MQCRVHLLFAGLRAYRHASRAGVLAILSALLLAPGAGAAPTNERTLWPSPQPGLDAVVGEQTMNSVARWPTNVPLGQTFDWPDPAPLVRIDVLLQNNNDPRPGQVALYALAVPDDVSSRGPVLWQDSVDLTGRSERQHRTFRPETGLLPAGQYYIEFTSPARDDFRVMGSPLGDPTLYDGGDMFRNGQVQTADLWFRVFTDDSGGSPTLPVVEVPGPVPAPLLPKPASPGAVEDDYLARLTAYAASVRTAALGQPLGNSHNFAFNEAMLAITGGDCGGDCVEQAAQMLVFAYDWREQQCGEIDDPATLDYTDGCVNIDFLWVPAPALAYAFIRDHPSFPEASRAMVETVLLDSARRIWAEHQAAASVFDVLEVGDNAGAVGQMLAFGLIAALFPSDPDAADWAAYAECSWSYFWHYRDSEEDSGQYQGDFWRFLLPYIELTGRGDPSDPASVWNDPAFLELVDRFYRHTEPIGRFPLYGDSGGQGGSWPARVHLAETAATKTGDPRYRLWAERAWHYYTTHVCDGGVGNDHLFNSMFDVGLAYLAANPSLAAAPPPARGESLLVDHGLGGDEVAASAGAPVGQVFTAGSGPLVRLDVRLRNGGLETPGEIRLYEWLGDRASSVAQPPLFHASVDLTGLNLPTVRSFRPFVPVVPGASYYVELARASAPLFASFGAAGSYAGGSLVVDGTPDAAADLWLEAYELTGEGSSLSQRTLTRPMRFSEAFVPAFPNMPQCDGLRREREMLPRIGQGSPDRIPDKLVLKSGSDPDDLVAVFNLGSFGAGHGQMNMASLSTLGDQSSLLLEEAAQDYRQYTLSGTVQDFDESLPFTRRYAGGTYGTPGDRVTVTRFTDFRDATVAHLSFDDPHGWGIAQERRIYFLRNRLVWVRDAFTFPEAMSASVGPLWHVTDLANVVADPSPVAFDVYVHRPYHNVWHMANPRRFARIQLVPRPGTEIEAYPAPMYENADDPACDIPPNACGKFPMQCREGPTRIVSQRWSGQAVAGETRWFDTILLPHDAGELADDAIRVVYDDGAGAVVLEVDVAGETWTLVDNPGFPTLLETPGDELETDAAYLLARRSPGAPDRLLFAEATRIAVGDTDTTLPFPTTAELDPTYLTGGDQCANAAASGIPPAVACASPTSVPLSPWAALLLAGAALVAGLPQLRRTTESTRSP